MEVLHVDFYSGGKRDELPRKIFTDSGTIKVEKTIEVKLEEDFDSKNREKIFIFQSQNKKIFRLTIKKDVFNLKEIKKEK